MAWPTGPIRLFAGAAFVAAATASVLVWESGGQLPIAVPTALAPAKQTPTTAYAGTGPSLAFAPTPIQSVAGVSPTPTPAHSASPRAAKIVETPQEKPGFDVVRVEPGGDAVVAGHGPAKVQIDLRVDGAVVDSAVADEAGQVVFVPPPLSPGPHVLELATSQNGGAPIVSSAANVVVDPKVLVKAPPSPNAIVVAVAATPRPSNAVALSTPKPSPAVEPTPTPLPPLSPPGTTQVASIAAPPSPENKPIPLASLAKAQVFVFSVEATVAGRLKVKGSTEPGRTVRLSLNGTFVADAVAGPTGQWSLTIQHGMISGDYSLRAEVVDAADGAVVARAEVPFVYPRTFPTPANSVVAALPPPGTSPTSSLVTQLEPNPGPTTVESQAPMPSPAQSVVALVGTTPQSSENKTSALPTPSPVETTNVASGASPVPTSVPSVEAAPTPGSMDARSPANVVVEDVRTTTVTRGDTLWLFGQRYYGNGALYRQIYAANTKQIRDPHWIFPGQIFVVPESK